MRKIFLAILCLAVLAGCTTYYSKPGKNNADFERDRKYCQEIAEQEAARRGTRVCDEIDRCLINKKGWKRY